MTKAILEAARKKIEQGWTQGAVARDESGVPLAFLDHQAVCWCAFGAISLVALNIRFDDRRGLSRRAIEHVKTFIVGESISLQLWNDTPGRTKEEVLDLFDKAIEACDESNP